LLSELTLGQRRAKNSRSWKATDSGEIFFFGILKRMFGFFVLPRLGGTPPAHAIIGVFNGFAAASSFFDGVSKEAGATG
jgi:hypothetical protein